MLAFHEQSLHPLNKHKSEFASSSTAPVGNSVVEGKDVLSRSLFPLAFSGVAEG